jgi:xylose isomerase
MRTYLILKEKVAAFNADPEIQAALGELRDRGAKIGQRVKFSADSARRIKAQSFDLETLRARGYAYERLDQLTMELLLGVR